MNIRYKLIEQERFQDAPFTGALVCAVGCDLNCPGCFNESVKQMPTSIQSAEGIVKSISDNPFNEGIILGGLEWSLQPDELLELVKTALEQDLKVMIYTGLPLEQFLDRVPRLVTVEGEIYIKHGAYDSSLSHVQPVMYGVKLASENQRIDKLKTVQTQFFSQI